METTNHNGKLIIALILTGIILAGTASANGLTTNVTVDPTLVKGAETSTYTFTIANNGPDYSIKEIGITIPSGFTGITSITCPYDWYSSYYGGVVYCIGHIGTEIAPGDSGTLTFSARFLLLSVILLIAGVLKHGMMLVIILILTLRQPLT